MPTSSLQKQARKPRYEKKRLCYVGCGVGGRPKANRNKVRHALARYDAKEWSVSEIVKETGISKATLYRAWKECKI